MECAYYRVGTSHSSRHTPLCRQPEVDLALSKSQERHMECAYYRVGTSHSSRHTPLCRQPKVDLALSKSQERHMECAYYFALPLGTVAQ